LLQPAVLTTILVMFALIGAGTVASFFRGLLISWNGDVLILVKGRVRIHGFEDKSRVSANNRVEVLPRVKLSNIPGLFSFERTTMAFTPPLRTWTLMFPIPMLGLPPAIAAVWIAAPMWRRKRRRSRQQCVACGYDLTASADNSACPECGSPLGV